MIPVRPDDAMCDAPDEGAALGLLGLMSGLSEENWCASWLTGLEFSLWHAREGGERRLGMGEVSARQCDLLRLLSEECDGWWVLADTDLKFVRLDAWRERLAALTATKAEQPPA